MSSFLVSVPPPSSTELGRWPKLTKHQLLCEQVHSACLAVPGSPWAWAVSDAHRIWQARWCSEHFKLPAWTVTCSVFGEGKACMRKKLLVTPSRQDWVRVCVCLLGAPVIGQLGTTPSARSCGCLGIVLVKKRETIWLTLGPASKSGSVCLLCMVLLPAVDTWICFSPNCKSLSLSSTPLCPGWFGGSSFFLFLQRFLFALICIYDKAKILFKFNF